ncbi:TrmH family RNA methyltransferase [Candidatus Neomarinimicrobiota bacterium]
MLSHSDNKLIKSLGKKKYRKLHQIFVIEGERLVSEAVQSNVVIKQIYITDEFIAKPQHNSLMDLIANNAIITNSIGEKEMRGICDTASPSGILALCTLPNSLNIDIKKSENWLYLDEIQDPGNLGTLLRSADWFGVKNIAFSENCVDAFNTKVLRGGMGSQFRLNLLDSVSLKDFAKASHTIIGAFQNGESIYALDTKTLMPWVLVIGNEAHGINGKNNDQITVKVTIPTLGSGESLNAAVAGSILLYHLTKPL